MTDAPDIPEGHDPADEAAERSLRLNAGPIDAAQARRAETDAAFAAEVAAWDERFAPLYDEIDPVAAPAAVWPRVEAAIAAPSSVAGPGRAANDNLATRFWRGWAMASTSFLAASIAGIAFLVANPRVEERIVERTVQAPAPEFQPVSVATLMSATDPDMPIATITYDPQTGSLHVSPTMQMQPGEGQVPTLWLMTPEGGVQRVGGIDPAHARTHSIPMEMRGMAVDAPALAVSLEPADNPDSPTPLGPVVASGEVARL